MKNKIKNLKMRVSNEDFAIVKAKKFDPMAFANIKYQKELTLIINEQRINKENVLAIERGWKLITFDMILPFNLVGFIAKVSDTLAKEDISIFVISSYSTDHILVKKENLRKAIDVLEKL